MGNCSSGPDDTGKGKKKGGGKKAKKDSMEKPSQKKGSKKGSSSKLGASSRDPTPSASQRRDAPPSGGPSDTTTHESSVRSTGGNPLHGPVPATAPRSRSESPATFGVPAEQAAHAPVPVPHERVFERSKSATGIDDGAASDEPSNGPSSASGSVGDPPLSPQAPVPAIAPATPPVAAAGGAPPAAEVGAAAGGGEKPPGDGEKGEDELTEDDEGEVVAGIDEDVPMLWHQTNPFHCQALYTGEVDSFLSEESMATIDELVAHAQPTTLAQWKTGTPVDDSVGRITRHRARKLRKWLDGIGVEVATAPLADSSDAAPTLIAGALTKEHLEFNDKSLSRAERGSNSSRKSGSNRSRSSRQSSRADKRKKKDAPESPEIVQDEAGSAAEGGVGAGKQASNLDDLLLLVGNAPRPRRKSNVRDAEATAATAAATSPGTPGGSRHRPVAKSPR